MNTMQLECFLAVSSSLNFAKAAEELHMTQPAVTHQIRSLETELDARLFRRTTRTVSLTQEGMTFLTDAHNILQAMNRAKGRMKKADEAVFSQLIIGCHSPHEYELLPNLLRQLRQSCPDIHPSLKFTSTRGLENMLEEETIDLMLHFQQQKLEKHHWNFFHLLDAPLSFVLPKGHPACRGAISPKLLEHENLVLVEPRTIPPEVFSLQLPYVELHAPSQLHFCEEQASALALVQSGFGIGIIADLMPLHKPGLVYRPVPDIPPIPYGIYCKSPIRHRELKSFLHIAEKAFKGDVSDL